MIAASSFAKPVGKGADAFVKKVRGPDRFAYSDRAFTEGTFVFRMI